MLKRCNKCGELKARDHFYKCSTKSDGLQGRCKPCQHADAGARARKNPEKAAAQAAKWRAKNIEKARSMAREWARKDYQANKARWRGYEKKYKKKISAEVQPVYVKALIARRVGCRPSEVPEQLVSAKAAWLRLARAISKEKK